MFVVPAKAGRSRDDGFGSIEFQGKFQYSADASRTKMSIIATPVANRLVAFILFLWSSSGRYKDSAATNADELSNRPLAGISFT